MIEDLLREYQARDGKKPAGEAEAPFEWKRPATVAGGFVLAVTLLGGLLGSWSGSAVDETKAPARSTTKLLVPPAKGLTAMDASAEAAEEPLAAPVAAVQPVIERRRAPRVQARPVDRLAGVSEAIESPVVEAAAPSEPEASGPVDAAVIQASAPAPIPDTVIARTIHKIGYACGRVASTSPVEGSGSGVFKVTCTSGHSYQATPVHGRYRFRRSQ